MALACALVLGAIVFFPSEAVDAVEVAGARHLERDEVVRLTGLVGKPVFAASAAEARAVLLRSPAVRDARVELGLPGSARVTLFEREAAGRWIAGGLEWFVDGSGVLFSSIDPTAAPALRVRDERAAARSAGERLDPAVVAAALRLAKVAPGELRADAAAPAVRVEAGPHGIVLESGAGWEVRFGGAESVEEKLALALRFLKDSGGRRLEYVDVRSPERIVYSPQ